MLMVKTGFFQCNLARTHFLSCLCALTICLLVSVVQAEDYGGGSGTAEDPYHIWTPEQMNTIGIDPNDWDKHFILMDDIDLSIYTGQEYNTIGHYKGYMDPNNEPFTGVFDGNEYTISNFTYNSTEEIGHIAIFAYVAGQETEIKNLGLIDPNVYVTDGVLVGSLVGRLWVGTVTNCYVEGGWILADEISGGLVGDNYGGTISYCYATCSD